VGEAGDLPGELPVASDGGGDNEIRSFTSNGFEDGGDISTTSLESMKVGGLCSSRQSATCHVPTTLLAIEGPVDGAEKKIKDHMRPVLE
jgi:hypothetical protein